MEIRIKDKKLVDLVREKEELVNQGRAVSVQLESIDAQLEILKEEEKKHSGAVMPEELIKRGDEIRDTINKLVEELQTIANEIHEKKLAGIPQEVKEKHVALAKEKEKLEKELNKIGLKIEKIKTRYIPKIQKIALPQLTDPYDDLETSRLEGDDIIVSTFNHLSLWKEQFEKRRKS